MVFGWVLERECYVRPANRKAHDFHLFSKYFVDLKCVNTKYYSIHEDKLISGYLEWVMSSIESGHLTHYGFYRMNRPPRPLMLNDRVSFEMISVVPALEVLDNMKVSQQPCGGVYYMVN